MNRLSLLLLLVVLISCREEPAAFEHVNPLDPESPSFQLPELGSVVFSISSSRARFNWTGTFPTARVIIERKVGSGDFDPIGDVSAGANFWQDMDLQLPQPSEVRYRLFSILGERSSDTLMSPVLMSTPCEWRYEMEEAPLNKLQLKESRSCTAVQQIITPDTITFRHPPSSAQLSRRQPGGPYVPLQQLVGTSNRTFTISDTVHTQFRVDLTYRFDHNVTWESPPYILRRNAFMDSELTVRGGVDPSRPNVEVPDFGLILPVTQWLPAVGASQHGFFLMIPRWMEWGTFTTLPSIDYTITSLVNGRPSSANDQHMVYVSSKGNIGEIHPITGTHTPFTLPAKDIPRKVFSKTAQNQFPIAIEDRDTGALSLSMFSAYPFAEAWRISIDVIPLHVVYRQSNNQVLLFGKGLQIRNAISGAVIQDWDQSDIAYMFHPVPNAIRMAFKSTGQIVDYDLLSFTSTTILTGLTYDDIMIDSECGASLILGSDIWGIDVCDNQYRVYPKWELALNGMTDVRFFGNSDLFTGYREGLLHIGRFRLQRQIVADSTIPD